MHEWFDIASLADPSLEPERQVDGLMLSVEYIWKVLSHELKTVPAERIFIGGMSQGCATAVTALLAAAGTKLRFAGFMGLFSWLPFQKELNEGKCLGRL